MSSAAGPTLRIGGLEIGGTRRTAVIVPVSGSSAEEVLESARRCLGGGADLLELRCDAMCSADGTPASGEEIARAAAAVRALIAPLPLLVTLRTALEGGQRTVNASEYAEILDAVIMAAAADALDVEMLWDRETACDIATRATAAGIPVIGSHHDFRRTPTVEEMLDALHLIEVLGADAAKIAVMPTEPRDVLRLLEATLIAGEVAEIPLITISMGSLGAISRIGGGLFGSAATFATIDRSSAPGQLPAARLLEAMDLLES